MRNEQSPIENEIQTLPYAGYGSESNARPPRLLFRNAQRCLIGFAVLIGLGLVFDVLLIASILGLVAAGLAVVWVGGAARHNRIQSVPAPMLVDAQTIRKFRALSVMALVSCLAIAGFMLPRWMTAAASVSASSASMANLRGIESALFIYISEYDAPADSLQRLIDTRMCTSRNLIEPMDQAGTPPHQTFYSSYAYFPTADYFGVCDVSANVVFAFSKKARFTNSGGLRREWQRAVGFGGRVELMTDREFQAALAKDKQARRKLGWPVYEWNEETQSVVEITTDGEE